MVGSAVTKRGCKVPFPCRHVFGSGPPRKIWNLEATAFWASRKVLFMTISLTIGTSFFQRNYIYKYSYFLDLCTCINIFQSWFLPLTVYIHCSSNCFAMLFKISINVCYSFWSTNTPVNYFYIFIYYNIFSKEN